MPIRFDRCRLVRPIPRFAVYTHTSVQYRVGRLRMSHSNVVFSHRSGKFHLCTRRDGGGCSGLCIDTATYNKCIWAAVPLFDSGPHTQARPPHLYPNTAPLTLELIDSEMQRPRDAKKRKKHQRWWSVFIFSISPALSVNLLQEVSI